MEQAIKKAIEGGWTFNDILNEQGLLWKVEDHFMNGRHNLNIYQFLLDPLFWQALGKAEDFEGSTYRWQRECEEKWLSFWHLFIDHIASGGSMDEFFEQLLTK